ncbi:hypothetical protein [Flavobacterium panici]|uniref:Uncharacterized protein n=1 Tax=Flavobacterium panici TaxID=2654843 RepID=A0A9N8J1G2_9FLAO|nr:hypothetical protein [Flavobacterium panici]CAC9974438.1 hypothetical protein FLAPXU55_02135 [Flavobacterium panici]
MNIDRNNERGFDKGLIVEWENNDGVNFAIALARITGWLLHVDWFGKTQDDLPENMKSLRVYVGTDANLAIDFKGIHNLQEFYNNTITPIVIKRANGQGGVVTRYYSEDDLKSLPLRVKADENKIKIAEKAILNNLDFLESIPKRLNPKIPAHLAGKFSFGWCMVFAHAKQELEKLPAMSIIATKYTEEFSGTPLGYCHTVNIHPDGEGEDVWGKQPLINILARYGVDKYSLSTEDHLKNTERLMKNSPEKYKYAYNLAVDMIRNS